MNRPVEDKDHGRSKRGAPRFKPTSDKGTNGGPDAISAAFVPGRILRVTPLSGLVRSASSGDILPRVGGPGKVEFGKAFMVGDLRPIWTSGIGGGLGKRGEDEGDRVRVSSIANFGNKKKKN